MTKTPTYVYPPDAPPAPVREVPALERAARAMCLVEGVPFGAMVAVKRGHVEFSAPAHEVYAALFAVGLLAIREPTEAMIEAAPVDPGFADEPPGPTPPTDVWQAIIDEVLK